VTLERVIAAAFAAGAAIAAGDASAQVRSAPPDRPAIALRVTDRDFFHRGDRISVDFVTSADAYVTVFRVDTDGRVRFLFPATPWDRNFVVADRRHRVRSPYTGAEHAFWVDDYAGVGYVFAVASADPFQYSSYMLNDHWDYRAVANAGRISGDPYLALAGLIAHMVPPGYEAYGYDVVSYFVESRYDYPRFLCYDCHAYVPYPVWDPYRDWCATFRVVIYDPPPRYLGRAYPAEAVVYPARVVLEPRYVFKTRGPSDPFVERVTGTREVPAARDRGVTGRDVGGVGTVRTPAPEPTPPAARGADAAVRRLPGGGARREAPDSATLPSGARPQTRPQLERRAPARDSTPRPDVRRPVKKPEDAAPQPAKRPSSSGARRPGAATRGPRADG
jgi:hypothetical protein